METGQREEQRIAELTPRDAQRANTLQVIVREETPFLPRVAITLITLASMAGAVFSGEGLGVDGVTLWLRWLSLWSVGLATGFLIWRIYYLRLEEPGLDPERVNALNATALTRADQVVRALAPVLAVGSTGALFVGYLDDRPVLRWLLFAGAMTLAGLLLFGVRRLMVAVPAAAIAVGILAGWAYADTWGGWDGWIRVTHLLAFSAWVGGALWNITVAMPAGRAHPHVDAVLAGARQLDRFRWVVRFALPTIIVTGTMMAFGYREVPGDWWIDYPGLLIPLKVLTIIALIAVFIACPLFRQCSPVKGVCNVDDLYDGAPEPSKEKL